MNPYDRFHNQRTINQSPRIGWLVWRFECWPHKPRGLGLTFDRKSWSPLSSIPNYSDSLEIKITIWQEFRLKFYWLSRKGEKYIAKQARLRAERVAEWEKEQAEFRLTNN